MELSRASKGFLVAAAILYTVFLVWYHSPYAGGADSSGYLNSAQLLLQGELHPPVRLPAGLTPDVLPPGHFVPLGFQLDAALENQVPTYPIGLPMHLGAAGLMVGIDHAATLVGVLAALAFALLLYFTAREFGVRPNWSASVAGLAAISPLTLYYALQPMSDLVAAVWGLVVILGALRANRNPNWAIVAGVALAIAVLVRPTNALFLLPAAIALPTKFRSWLLFLLGGLPGALLLALYNHSLYGSVFSTGYSNLSEMLEITFIPLTLEHYARYVPVVATPFIFAALALPWVKTTGKNKRVLIVWAGGLFAFYTAYFCTHETWWYLRFILPALPAVAIAAALVLQQIRYPSWLLASRLLPAEAPTAEIARGRVFRLSFPIILLLASAAWMLKWDKHYRISKVELDERAYPLTGRWVAEHMPADAVLAAYQVSGAVQHYSPHASLNFTMITPQEYDRLNRWLGSQRRDLYAAVFPHEESILRQRMPGQWELVAQHRQANIWRRTALNELPLISVPK